ncbi:MAG: flagellar FliJ family protein [Phycisphaerales bacterium]|nr:flagellar FliJ family protein [Phycisphaerales bacterium]
MPRFIFRLQALLDQRSRAQRDEQLIVAALETERLDLQRRIHAHQWTIQQGKEELRDVLSPHDTGSVVVEAAHLHRCAAASVAIDRAARRLVLQLAGVHHKLEHARAQLLNADIQLKVVERLKTRQYERWRCAQDRREAIELDELATMRTGRRNGDQSC